MDDFALGLLIGFLLGCLAAWALMVLVAFVSMQGEE